ncbi:short-chain dehydrogenase/reductase SDR [Mrakia frigida]|uniref:SDR family oxidoreductase n=1 Tax=Mrakia frigida TaxID=29902 RepID=UPI003FCC171E
MSKVAIVTGGSSGIGRATSEALAKAGYKVVLSGRRQTELDNSEQLCLEAQPTKAPENILTVAGDVSNQEAVVALFKAAVDKFGRVDVVFNNAGIGAPDVAIEDLPVVTFDAVMAVNVRAAFLITQEAVRQFKVQQPQGGRLINNGSISAHVPRMNSAPYTMSKHAITGLTKCTQLDGRAFNIACSQIDIGNATTALGDTSAPKAQPSGHDLVEASFPVSDVADAVVYMSGLPLTTNVATMTIMATTMPSYIGRG